MNIAEELLKQAEDEQLKPKVKINNQTAEPDIRDQSLNLSVSYEDLPDMSQDELAVRLGESSWDENVKHIHKLNRWLYWDKSRWVVDEKLMHMTSVRRFLNNQAEKYVLSAKMMNIENSEKIIKKAKYEAKQMKSASSVSSVVSLARSNQKSIASVEDFDGDLYLLGTPSGTVDLKTGQTYEAVREHMITKFTGTSQEDGDPVLWLNFLNKIFNGDAELIEFIQKLCGYSLTGSVAEQRLFFMYGKGANGKSVLINILFHILDEYARRAPATLFLEQKNDQHPTALAGLHSARLVVGSELPTGKVWNESMVKDMTGGDIITAHLMRQDYFDFKPQFTLIIAGNHQPRIKSIDESTIRRMVLIPFKVTIPIDERDQHLEKKLKSESGKILTWMISGATKYCQSGLTLPKAVQEASSEYIKSEDSVGEFLGLYIKKSGNRTDFDSVYEAYSEWFKLQGYLVTMVKRTFKKELKDRGYEIYRSNSVEYIKECEFTGLSNPIS